MINSWLLSITLADLPIQLRSWPLFSSFSWNLEPSSCFRMLPIVDWPLGFLQTTLLWCHRPKWRRPEWSKPRTPVKKCSKPSNPWWKGFDSKRNRKLKMRCWIGFSIPQLLCRFFSGFLQKKLKLVLSNLADVSLSLSSPKNGTAFKIIFLLLVTK